MANGLELQSTESRNWIQIIVGGRIFRQSLLIIGLFVLWYVLTETKVLSPFFFGRPLVVLSQVYDWFHSGIIWEHLAVTLFETASAFLAGLFLGLVFGLWLGLDSKTCELLEPLIKAANSMPRVVLVPIFVVWFGLGMLSKIAFGVTLVFFIVFFNVMNGVREVNPAVLANARMLGASKRQLLWNLYLPSATSWVFSSLHTSVGMAFVGAVVGEYLGSARGLGYLILQAEGVFDIDAVLAGVCVLTVCALILDYCVTLTERRLMPWRL
jgi:NitT/TauT family transport system permease protein